MPPVTASPDVPEDTVQFVLGVYTPNQSSKTKTTATMARNKLTITSIERHVTRRHFDDMSISASSPSLV